MSIESRENSQFLPQAGNSEDLFKEVAMGLGYSDGPDLDDSFVKFYVGSLLGSVIRDAESGSERSLYALLNGKEKVYYNSHPALEEQPEHLPVPFRTFVEKSFMLAHQIAESDRKTAGLINDFPNGTITYQGFARKDRKPPTSEEMQTLMVEWLEREL